MKTRRFTKLNKGISLMLMVLLFSLVLVIIYEIPPRYIKVHEIDSYAGDVKIVSKAKDLIAQDVSETGVWASRGFDIYFKDNDETRFKRISRLQVPFGIYSALSFRLIRLILNKQEMLELLFVEDNKLIAFGGGYIYNSFDNGETFMEVAEMDHYGMKIGRGIMPQGYTINATKEIFWGEYWNNEVRGPVKLMKSSDYGKTWKTFLEFDNGEIFHIHAVQYDPIFDAVWIATGDADNECKIMYTADNGHSFHEIGYGSQKWRACSLIFGKDKVYWGMDGASDDTPSQIWSWDRSNGATESLTKVESYAFYSAILSNESMFISTNGNQPPDPATLWVSEDGIYWKKAFKSSRKRKNHFGTIRLLANEDQLMASIINLSKFNNDLLFMEVN